MEREYFEQLLNAKFGHIESNIKDLKEDTEKILVQTKITNGRVTKLETWQAQLIGEATGENRNSKKTNWIIVLLVSILGTLGTIWATQIWN